MKRTAKALVTLALAPIGLGCVVSHEARRAPLGDPAAPALRATGVTTGLSVHEPGQMQTSVRRNWWGYPTVTAEGWALRDVGSADDQRVVVFDLRLEGGAGAGDRADHSVSLLDMTWSPAGAPRCAGGHPALDVLVTQQGPLNHRLADPRQVRWERPIILRGERLVSGRFDEDPSLLQQPSVVDVHVLQQDGAGMREWCVRVPVTGPEVLYWNATRWSVGVRVDWRRALSFSPDGVFTGGATLGRWVGPVRLGLGGFVGGTSGGALGGPRLEVGGVAARWLRWGLGWSVVTEAIFAGDRGSSGGARLGLQFLRVAPNIIGESPFAPTSAWGLEVFATAAQTWSGPNTGSPVTYGLALVGF